MKRLAIAAAAGAILLVAALALVVANTSGDLAAAQDVEVEEQDTAQHRTVDDVLRGLVEEGVIDEDQARRVAEALREHAEQRLRGPWQGDPDGHERSDKQHRFRGNFRGEALKELFGDVSREELREAFENGTLDELIDREALVDRIRTAAEERIGAAIDKGHITAEQGQELLDKVQEKTESFLSGDFDFGSWKRPRFHRDVEDKDT